MSATPQVTVAPGETLFVELTITNTGDVDGNQTVTLTNSVGDVLDSVSGVVVSPGNTSTVGPLKWTTTSGDEGTYTLSVSSDNDTEMLEVEVTGSTGGTGEKIYPSQPLQSTTYAPYENVQPDSAVTNPVLTASDVTDENASFVADPYLYVPDSNDNFSDWQMFFETARSNGAVIGHATSPDNGLTWNYNQTVINADSHLSMPHVFRSEGDYYLIANRKQNDYLPLYRAETWPTDWTEVNQWLSSGPSEFKDHLLYWKDAESRWYLLNGTDDGGNNGGIRVYYSNQNESIENITWNAHPENPVVSGRPSAARAAGRGHILNDGEIVAFFQDTVAEYGDKARAFEITTLTTTSYADSEYSQSPILEESGAGWNSDRMHHYDPWWVESEDKWRAAVDGYDGSGWSIGIYQAGP